MHSYSPPTPLSMLGQHLKSLSKESRAALAGLLLAPLMLLLLCLTLTDNMAKAEQKRLTQEAYAQQQRACRAQPTRLGREQCMLDLGPGSAVLTQR